MGILKSDAAIFDIFIFWPVLANFIAENSSFFKKTHFFAIKLAETGQKQAKNRPKQAKNLGSLRKY